MTVPMAVARPQDSPVNFAPGLRTGLARPRPEPSALRGMLLAALATAALAFARLPVTPPAAPPAPRARSIPQPPPMVSAQRATPDDLVAWQPRAEPDAPAPAQRPVTGWTPRARRSPLLMWDQAKLDEMTDWSEIDWTRVDLNVKHLWREACRIDKDARCGTNELGQPTIDTPESRETLLSYDPKQPTERRSVWRIEDAEGTRVRDYWSRLCGYNAWRAIYVSRVLKRRPPATRRVPIAAAKPSLDPRPRLRRRDFGTWSRRDAPVR